MENTRIESLVRHIRLGRRLTPEQGMELWHTMPLAQLGALAWERKLAVSGRAVYYNRNFHIEPTNLCAFRCRFCSYRREAGDAQAWDYSLDDIEGIARRYVGSGVTEVHIVGGVHPEHDLAHYEEMIRRVKAILPEATIKAFTAIELGWMIERAGLSYTEGLERLRRAGMEAMPGGGAEIFDEELRRRICPEKGSTAQWLAVHRAAHESGMPSNATILYGHVETVAHRVDHLERLRRLQDETGGFNAFIPLKYRSVGNPMERLGEVSLAEDLRMLAFSRLYLDNFPHIKAYWPMYGKTTTELALSFGADDIDGTIDATTRIYSMAGAEDQAPRMTPDEVERMASAAGLQAVERDTFYQPVQRCSHE